MRMLILALLLGGCAYTTYSTDVQPVGQNTYSVGATAGRYVGGSAEARSLAFRKANDYCAKQDRAANVLTVEPADIRATVTFSCVSPGTAPAYPAGQNVNMNVNVGR